MFTLTTRTTGKIRLRRVAFSPDGTRLDTCGDRGEVRAWHVATRRCICAPPMHWPLANVFIGGNELFVLNQYAKSLTAHHVETNYIRLLGHADIVAPSPDGQRVFCCLD